MNFSQLTDWMDISIGGIPAFTCTIDDETGAYFAVDEATEGERQFLIYSSGVIQEWDASRCMWQTRVGVRLSDVRRLN